MTDESGLSERRNECTGQVNDAMTSNHTEVEKSVSQGYEMR